MVDAGERRGAALGGGPERLFEDGRQAARLVAGRGVVVHLAAVALGVGLPPMDHVDELLADLAGRGAARQEVLGPVDLGRLRQDRGAAVPHQQIGRGPERRIGRDARIAVRAAALQRQHQFGRRQGLAPGRVGGRHHVAQPRHTGLDGLPGAAGLLDRHGLEVFALREAVFALHAADLEHFAAEPDHQHPGDVGVRPHSPTGCASSASKPAPLSAMPQPVPCTRAITPSIFG